MQHSFNLLQSWVLLLFFMFSYILIENGLQLAESEIRFFTDKRKQAIEAAKENLKIYEESAKDQSRYNNMDSSKCPTR